MRNCSRCKSIRFVVAGLCLCALLMGPLATRKAQASEARVALIIGNSDYKHNPLSNPGKDVALIAQTLEGLGFKVYKAENTNLRRMRRLLVKFGDLLDKAEVGLFYYSGHGVQTGGKNYLLPIDALIDSELDLEFEALALGRVLVELREAKSATKLLVLDASYDKPLGAKVHLKEPGLAEIQAPPGVLVAFSSSPGKITPKVSGATSAFAEEFSRQITLPGLSFSQVLSQTAAAVKKQTAERQGPWYASSLQKELVLVDSGETGEMQSLQPAAPKDAPSKAAQPAETLKAATPPKTEAAKETGETGETATSPKAGEGGAPAPAEPKSEIGQLLDQANQYLSQGRLDGPPGQNPIDLYKRILEIDPNNEAAQFGLERIVDKYADYAETALQKKDFSMAWRYIGAGERVLPKTKRMANIMAKLEDAVQTEPAGKAKPGQTSAPQPAPTAAKVLSSAQKEKLARLLNTADKLLAGGSLTTPKGKNAYEKYLAALDIDPDSQAAKKGLEQIVGKYAGLVDSRINAGDYDLAKVYLKRAIKVSPEDPRVVELAEKLAAATGGGEPKPAKPAVDPAVSQLLAKADKFLEQGRYVAPPGNNAYENYRQALKLDPGNQAARKGLDRIVGKYAEVVESGIKSGDYEMAGFYLKQAESVNPEDSRLISLRRKLRTARGGGQETGLAGGQKSPAKQEKPPARPASPHSAEIKRLLGEAEQYMSLGSYLTPKGKNANEKYHHVLDLDPENTEARNGLNRIVAKYAEEIKSSIESKDYDMAGFYLSQADQVIPGDPMLAALKKKLGKIQSGISTSAEPKIPAHTALYSQDGRYFRDAQGIITDTRTNLQWAVGPDRQTDFDEARSWVEELGLGGGGWRLPKVVELRRIYKPKKDDIKLSTIFPTTGWVVWSGEFEGSQDAYSGQPPYRYDYKLSRKHIADRSSSGPERVFAVRSKPNSYPALPARTPAITVKENTRPITATPAVKSKPASDNRSADGRFVRNALGIITDTRTGLQWLSGPDKETDFYEAQTWIESLWNKHGGGWRLPTVVELNQIGQKGKYRNNLAPIFKMSGWRFWSGQAAGPLDGSYYDSDPWQFDFRSFTRYTSSRNSTGPERVLAVRPR